MLSDAVRLGMLASNPAARVDMPKPPKTGGQEIPIEHLRAIREALGKLAPDDPLRPGTNDMLAPLAFDLALSSALRWSELAGLQWGVCDFTERSIRVERAVVLRKTKAPKSGRERTIPMFQGAHDALRALAARALECGRYGPSEYVVPTVTGTPHDCSNWSYRIWQPALKEAKLDRSGYRWHDLRHTCISRLVAEGADIALVQDVCGHSSAATTLAVYSHLSDNRRQTAATKYDPMRGLLAER
jgi:integrase